MRIFILLNPKKETNNQTLKKNTFIITLTPFTFNTFSFITTGYQKIVPHGLGSFIEDYRTSKAIVRDLVVDSIWRSLHKKFQPEDRKSITPVQVKCPPQLLVNI